MSELTTDMLRNWYARLTEDQSEHDVYPDGIPRYSILITPEAARCYKQAMKRFKKRWMSNRAKLLLRNRRRMK